jgi:hypothetical protein
MRKALNRYLSLITVAVVAAAVLDQLRRPSAERTWHGAVFGIVPYDFRPPTFERFKAAWWNPDDPRIFTPRDLGVGWAVNLPRLIELVTNTIRRNRAA